MEAYVVLGVLAVFVLLLAILHDYCPVPSILGGCSWLSWTDAQIGPSIPKPANFPFGKDSDFYLNVGEAILLALGGLIAYLGHRASKRAVLAAGFVFIAIALLAFATGVPFG